MPSKKRSCRDWKLYVITDPGVPAAGLHLAVLAAIQGGADVIQLRDKTLSDDDLTALAKSILEVTQAQGVPLIINDRLRVAKASGADGLHLGQDDGSLAEARLFLGNSVILGRSTHSPEQAIAAEKEGADYIGIGPVFKTPTKADYDPVGLPLVSFAAKSISVPFVAIGGIDENNAGLVRDAGARTIAVVRAVMASADPKNTAYALKRIMDPTKDEG